jgi:pimeloyl-ACP methyl ester carboxylesterase
MGGWWHIEERVFPVRWLFERGLDVALFALPFHGVRADPSRPGAAPIFPGADPRITIEGFRQAVMDLRDLLTLLWGRGAPAVGGIGMSLGAYTTALLATVEPRLAFAVPMIPLVSIADFARDTGRLVGTAAEQREQHDALATALQVVSPLARPSLLPPERLLVVAGEGDRITPLSHALQLAAHFEAPLHTFHGGHLLQFGRAEAFRAIGRMLGRHGLLAPR